MSSRRRPGAPADLEEVRPGRFLVHNPAIGPLLSNEGEREGDRFTLTSWRRDGLIGRLRARTFEVLTLADQIDLLPPLATAVPPGSPIVRDLAAGERISTFGGNPPGWVPVPEADQQALLRVGWVIRRRRGRGPADYYRVGGASALIALDEDEALLAGYAQLALEGAAALKLLLDGQYYLLPDLPLPAAHRTLIGRFADRSGEGWRVTQEALPLLSDFFARLGILLQR